MLTPEKEQRINEIVAEVAAEVIRATHMFEPLNSPHEAEGVIREEFEEFWDEVKAYNPRKNRDTRPQMRTELIQLAAMSVRGVLDVIDFGKHYEAQPCYSPVTTPSTTATSS